MSKDEKMFNILHQKETLINYENCDPHSSLKIINNGPKYSRYVNPYEKMVNLAMIEKDNSNKINFKSKAFFERALDLSKNPSNAKMDSYNPIFYFIANPSDYRYYYKYNEL